MALPISVVWEIRQAGNDNNGGGFVAGGTGTDFSQQDAAASSGTDLVVDAVTNTKVTSATHNFVAADVDNLMQITAGAGFTTGFYRIVSVAANAATLDRSPAATGTTGGTWAVGGALASIGKPAAAWLQGMEAFIKGAFTSTATATFAAGGSAPTSAIPLSRLRGYGTTRGDTGHATLTLATNTGLTGINCTGFGYSIEQIDVDCANLGTSTGIAVSFGSNVINCKVSNFTTRGINMGSTTSTVADCEATGGGSAATAAIGGAMTGGAYVRNFVHDNACPGIAASNSCVVSSNLVANNSGASSDGILVGQNCAVLRNTVHNNGRDGLRQSADNQMGNHWRNNIFTSNGGFGIKGNAVAAMPAHPNYDGNAYWNNTSGARSNMDSTTGIYGVAPYTNVRDVTLTGSPYVGGTTGTTANFALNNTAGAGAACRAAASPTSWVGNSGTTNYLDMGAVQHQDSGGGSGGPVGHGRLSGGLQ